jgi:hypothetical protein
MKRCTSRERGIGRWDPIEEWIKNVVYNLTSEKKCRISEYDVLNRKDSTGWNPVLMCYNFSTANTTARIISY